MELKIYRHDNWALRWMLAFGLIAGFWQVLSIDRSGNNVNVAMRNTPW